MRTSEVLGYVIVGALLIGALVFAGIMGSKADAERERQGKFTGACDYLGGKVHDDLCVKDGRVVLTRSK